MGVCVPPPSVDHAPSAPLPPLSKHRLYYVCDVCLALMVVSVDFGILSKTPQPVLRSAVYAARWLIAVNIGVKPTQAVVVFQCCPNNNHLIDTSGPELSEESSRFLLLCNFTLLLVVRSVSAQTCLHLSEKKQFCKHHHICCPVIVHRINGCGTCVLMGHSMASQSSSLLSAVAEKETQHHSKYDLIRVNEHTTSQFNTITVYSWISALNSLPYVYCTCNI